MLKPVGGYAALDQKRAFSLSAPLTRLLNRRVEGIIPLAGGAKVWMTNRRDYILVKCTIVEIRDPWIQWKCDLYRIEFNDKLKGVHVYLIDLIVYSKVE